MLPKQYRLSRIELNRVKKKGTLIQGNLFSLLVSRQQEAKQASQFGFIISTKIHKRAIKRNRVKRLLNEAIYSLLPKIKPGFETVFLAKKRIIDAGLEEIGVEVERLFIKARMME